MPQTVAVAESSQAGAKKNQVVQQPREQRCRSEADEDAETAWTSKHQFVPAPDQERYKKAQAPYGEQQSSTSQGKCLAHSIPDKEDMEEEQVVEELEAELQCEKDLRSAGVMEYEKAIGRLEVLCSDPLVNNEVSQAKKSSEIVALLEKQCPSGQPMKPVGGNKGGDPENRIPDKIYDLNDPRCMEFIKKVIEIVFNRLGVMAVTIEKKRVIHQKAQQSKMTKEDDHWWKNSPDKWGIPDVEDEYISAEFFGHLKRAQEAWAKWRPRILERDVTVGMETKTEARAQVEATRKVRLHKVKGTSTKTRFFELVLKYLGKDEMEKNQPRYMKELNISKEAFQFLVEVTEGMDLEDDDDDV
ncbi:hypothetical protein FB451DRAFT_1172843 [Mycena latifolia]|nr:hypothetical protein FB451DRAFT_1172843 [Mycena latifolia]